jgi:excisionase family DNA binding protein
MKTLEGLYDVHDVAALLHVHENTVYEWKTSGKLPSVSINGRVRFKPKTIEEFIEAGTIRVIDPAALTARVVIDLDNFDRLHLRSASKGGSAVNNQTRRSWNYGFGSVHLRKTKEGKDRWSIHCKDGRKRVREVVKDAQTRGEALVALQRRVAESFNGRFNPTRRVEPMRFARLAELYLDEHAKATKKSWRTDFYALKSHLTPYFGNLRLEDITPLVVEKYRTKRLRAVSESSTNREMALLKVMFNLAIDWGFASENPLRKVKMFSEKDNLKERVLTEEEETRLRAASAPHLRLIITGLLATGARISELMALRRSAVDLERRTILLTKTKSGRNRVIPINAQLHEVLTALKARSKGERVFAGPEGEPVASVRRAFVSACRRAGLKGVRMHDLRHTFATRLVRRGVDIITVRDLLGHSSVKLTERYTHSNEEQKREAVRRLEPETAKKAEDLSRLCHAEKTEGVQTPATLPLSVN